VGNVDGADTAPDAGKGGRLISYGGGGSPSVAVGECGLFRMSEFKEGEKSPLDCAYDCCPDWKPYGVP